MFVDHIRVFAQAGDGGNGVVSFRRAKNMPKGGPDGGDGGNGGCVILRCDNHTDNLRTFAYDPKLIATKGDHGKKSNCKGKDGRTIIGKVPPGTVIYRSPASAISEAVEMERDNDGIDLVPIADMTQHGQEIVLCQGGIGGKGNWNYKSSTNQAPQEHTLGTEGDQAVFYMELRRIADAGLVGFPNAGKSTLLGKLSAAEPKVGNYPFTTLNPTVGVVDFKGFSRCTVADIPGLIEGASENRGLGHEFLRHITRCQMLIFVVDIAGSECRDPVEDLQTLRTEISLYDKDLAKFEWVIVANKMDLEGAEENLQILKNRFPNKTIIPISALNEEGIDDLKAVLKESIGHRPDQLQEISPLLSEDDEEGDLEEIGE